MATTLVAALTTESVATKLADALMDGEHHLPLAAAGAFEQEPPHWRFEAWFTEAPDLGDFRMTVARILGPDVAGGIAFDTQVVDTTDWVSKSLEDLPPVRAGRFVVHGAHDADKVRANEIGLLVEASMAFGTGHHPTTWGCLAELDGIAARARVTARKGPPRRGDRRPALLDVGTGTGVLAIALVKALPIRAVAGDLDAEAVRIAVENVRLAGVAERLRVVEAFGARHPAMRAGAPYPLVVANILAGPLVASAGEFAKVTARGGTLILSGLLKWQARWVEGAYRANGFALARRRIVGDWATLTLMKR